MNFKTAVVGAGIMTSSLLGGCGQKAGKVANDVINPISKTLKCDTMYMPSLNPCRDSLKGDSLLMKIENQVKGILIPKTYVLDLENSTSSKVVYKLNTEI